MAILRPVQPGVRRVVVWSSSTTSVVLEVGVQRVNGAIDMIDR